ncbi:MAG: helix-turn-helix transcriptional regulator [Salinivirgaceae bacterium]|jgi:transcriptional regulator with XRE-family HTH domain|nr:helix-turn-helix transcriptional regulator [Salinivirgaceae bacterium]
MYLGKNIKKIRAIKKLSQSAFAEVFGITRSSIGAYEEGRAEPKLEVIIKIAKYFSISVDSLINSEITVNELSHFHLYDDLIESSSKVKNAELQIQILNIPLVTFEHVAMFGLKESVKEAKHSISLPRQKTGSVAIMINGLLNKQLPKQFANNDIIIVNPNAIKTKEIDCDNKRCLISTKDSIVIGELKAINANKFHMYYADNITVLLKSEINFVLTINCHISNQVVIFDDASEKIKKLEYMVKDLYHRLE